MLLANGAHASPRPCSCSNFKTNALHEATAINSGSILQLLLESDTCSLDAVNARDDDGLTPLINGIYEPSHYIQRYTKWRLLLTDGVDVSMKGHSFVEGGCALNLVGQMGIQQLLLEAETCSVDDVNSRNDFGFTPLMLAIRNQRYELCPLFLAHEAHVTPNNWIPKYGSHCRNGNERNAIHMATTAKDETLLQLLLESDSCSLDAVNARDKKGYTPLMLAIEYAAKFQNYNRCRLLLAHGADVSPTNSMFKGGNVFHISSKAGRAEYLQLLLNLRLVLSLLSMPETITAFLHSCTVSNMDTVLAFAC